MGWFFKTPAEKIIKINKKLKTASTNHARLEHHKITKKSQKERDKITHTQHRIIRHMRHLQSKKKKLQKQLKR